MDIEYILEVLIAGKVSTAVALPLVERVVIGRIPAEDFEWTLGVEPIFEHTGVREFAVELMGQSGTVSRQGQDRNGARLFATGPEIFKECEAFLEAYSVLAAERQRAGLSRPELVLRAPWEGRSFKVVQQDWNVTGAVDNGPFNRAWSMKLRVYAVDETKAGLGIFESLGSNPFKAAAKAIATATSYASIVDEQLASLQSGLDSVREPVQAVGNLAREASRLASAAQGLRSWPHDLAADLFSSANYATQAVFDNWAALPLVDRQSVRNLMLDVLAPLADIRQATLEWLGLNFIDVRQLPTPDVGSSYSSTLEGRTITVRAVRKFALSEGLDYADVAQAELGDRDQWSELVSLNGVADPFTTATGRPLEQGESVLVPSIRIGGPQSTAGQVFGTDLKLGPNGDLVARGDGAWATVSGKDNLYQAVRNRSQTEASDNAIFPSIGFPAVGDAGTAETAGLLASRARTQFLEDIRITRVDQIEVEDDGDSFVVRARIWAVNESPVQVALPVSRS